MDFNYEIIKELCIVKEYPRKNMKKEINIVKWGKDIPKIDIRYWMYDENGSKRPGKGLSISEEELIILLDNGEEYLGYLGTQTNH